jgi:hypothetical protein
VQPQLLTLVEVGRSGEPEHEECRRHGAPQADLTFQVGLGPARQQPRGAALLLRVGGHRQTVACGVPDDVVIGQHPGARGARLGGQVEVVVDDVAEGGTIEVGLEQIEVERLAESFGARVPGSAHTVHPGLGHRGARRRVAVEDGAPLRVDLMHLVAVPQRMSAPAWERVKGRLVRQILAQMLRQSVGDVDAKAVDAAVRPEPKGLEEVVPNLSVVPVEVRLLGGEVVQVPLAVPDRLP